MEEAQWPEKEEIEVPEEKLSDAVEQEIPTEEVMKNEWQRERKLKRVGPVYRIEGLEETKQTQEAQEQIGEGFAVKKMKECFLSRYCF